MYVWKLLLLSSGAWAANPIYVASAPGMNGFPTDGDKAFPAQFGLDEPSPFYWTNLTGNIINVQAYSETQNMIVWQAACLAYNDNSKCTSYEMSNPGGAFFGGPSWKGVGGNVVAVGGPWQIDIFWSPNTLTGTSFPTSTVSSPTFTVVSKLPATTAGATTSTSSGAASTGVTSSDDSSSKSGLSAGAAAGIGIGCAAAGFLIATAVFMLLRRRREQPSPEVAQAMTSKSPDTTYMPPAAGTPIQPGVTPVSAAAAPPYSTPESAPHELKHTYHQPQGQSHAVPPPQAAQELYTGERSYHELGSS
ncbi:hypothetical protein GQ53DRAFT_752982 [Thozetella sp. PMI_491]|nr:hypothetical protein GQ53DRAFT_752982 [Thozetella sp. PMI_491]